MYIYRRVWESAPFWFAFIKWNGTSISARGAKPPKGRQHQLDFWLFFSYSVRERSSVAARCISPKRLFLVALGRVGEGESIKTNLIGSVGQLIDV